MCTTSAALPLSCLPRTAAAFSIFSPAIASTTPDTTTPPSSPRSRTSWTAPGPPCCRATCRELAGELAQRLVQRAGGRLERVYLHATPAARAWRRPSSSARAHTRRDGLLYAEGAFHGLTCGALSLMSDAVLARQVSAPCCPARRRVPFGDLVEAWSSSWPRRRFAAFIVEPMQAEGGIRVPPPNYLRAAQALCRRYGTLFVLDEVQTGMYRTGPFLAAHRFRRRARHGDAGQGAQRRIGAGGRGADDARRCSDSVFSSLQARHRSCLHVRRKRPGHARGAGHAGCVWSRKRWASAGPRMGALSARTARRSAGAL